MSTNFKVITSDADNAARVEAAIRTLTEAGLLHWSKGIDEMEVVATLNVAIDEVEVVVGNRTTGEWVPQLRFDEPEDEQGEVRSLTYEVSRELWKIANKIFNP